MDQAGVDYTKACIAGDTTAKATFDATVANLKADYTKACIAGDTTAKATFDATVANLKAQREAYLTAQGFDADTYTRHYHCTTCKDTGYVKGEMCHCLLSIISEASFSQPQARHENFSTFSMDVYPPQTMADVKGRLKLFTHYCRHFEAMTDNYLFTGHPGRGKTFLSNCIVNALVDQGYRIIYITAAHLVKLVQEYLYNRGYDINDLYQALLDCDLLIIDDLGAEYSSKFSGSQLFEIINARILSGKKMIISTNLTTQDIVTQYDARLSSRIRGNFKTVPFYGDDIRLIKKQRQS